MTPWIIISGIIAPALFWAAFFYYKDRFKPEPLVSLGSAYLAGMVIAWLCMKTFPVLSVMGLPEDPSLLMGTHPFLFLVSSFVVVGLLEESFKLFPFLLFVRFSSALDEEIDGIIYASFIALGFASLENFHHLVYLRGFALFGRAVASPLTHTIFASIWGYLIARARLRNTNSLLALILGLGASAIIHGAFDFLTITASLRLISALLILIVWIWRIRTIESLQNSGTSTKG